MERHSDATTESIHMIACYIHDNGGSGPVQLDHNLFVEGAWPLDRRMSRGECPENGLSIQIYPSSDRVIVSGNTIIGAMRDGIIGKGRRERKSNAAIVNNVIAFNGRSGISRRTGGGGAVGADYIATANVVWADLPARSLGRGSAIS